MSLPDFRRVLDVPSGDGRLSRPLRALGYAVTAVDADPTVSPDVVLVLRELDRLPGDFDAVKMWTSFDWFDAAENRVLGSPARRLRPGGRLVLDLSATVTSTHSSGQLYAPAELAGLAAAHGRSRPSPRRTRRRCSSSSSATRPHPRGRREGAEDRRLGGRRIAGPADDAARPLAQTRCNETSLPRRKEHR